jgi:hypothetical protein
MVKNTIGGKRGKMMANKRVGNGGGDKKLRLSMNEDEKYVCVSKTFGGGMFKVIDNDGNEYNAILRGKMKGPNKRHNFVTLFSILLVGIRSDLSDSSICDILFVFDDHDILSLSLLPNLNLNNIISFHQNHGISDRKQHNDLFQIDSNSMNNDSVIITNNDNEKDTEIIENFDFNDI